MHRLSVPPDPLPAPAPGLCTAPLAAVLLALISLWMLAMPVPLHAVALHLEAGCATDQALPWPVHTVLITADNAVLLDGQRLADRPAIEAGLQALASPPSERPPLLQIVPHPSADYRSTVAVLAAAQRQNIAHLQVQAEGALLPMAACPRRIDDEGALVLR